MLEHSVPTPKKVITTTLLVSADSQIPSLVDIIFEYVPFFGPSSTPESISTVLPLPCIPSKFTPSDLPHVQDNSIPIPPPNLRLRIGRGRCCNRQRNVPTAGW